jgi:hypothetical protein
MHQAMSLPGACQTLTARWVVYQQQTPEYLSHGSQARLMAIHSSLRATQNLLFQLGLGRSVSWVMMCVLRTLLPLLLQELTMLQGKHTNEFAAVLGYATDGELIHRGNLALLLAGEACS